MKKRILTCLFLLSCLSFSAGLFANMVSSKSIITRDIQVKKQGPPGWELPGNLPADRFSATKTIRPFFSFGTCFNFEQPGISATCRAYASVIIKREMERLRKDHLLHLFPFHYFW